MSIREITGVYQKRDQVRLVEVGDNRVVLRVQEGVTSAGIALDYEEARHLARCLNRAARRIYFGETA